MYFFIIFDTFVIYKIAPLPIWLLFNVKHINIQFLFLHLQFKETHCADVSAMIADKGHPSISPCLTFLQIHSHPQSLTPNGHVVSHSPENDKPMNGLRQEDLVNQDLIIELRKEFGMIHNDFYMVLTDTDMRVKVTLRTLRTPALLDVKNNLN